MPFSIDRFRENVKRLLKDPERKKLMQAGEAYESLTSPEKKTAAIRNMMELLDREVAKKTRRELMESCGRRCICDSILKKALRLKEQAEDLDDLLVRLNKAHIGGGFLRRDGEAILAEYRRCYCGAVSRTKSNFPQTYCFCSCGWYRQLFETIFERPVKVELLGSIIQGDDSCRFRIQIR